MNKQYLPMIAVLAFLTGLCPAAASAAGTAAASPGEQPQFYQFRAETLGFPAGAVTARFEYRSGERVLANERMTFRFAGEATRLVAIPGSENLTRSDRSEEARRLFVWAGGLLVNVFDRDSLAGYNRVLGYTEADQVSTLVPSTKPGTNDIFCESPCDGGCGPYDDYDCDGVINLTDNCTDDYNPGQQDCDGDGYGNACDGSNATYQPTGSVDTCMTDRDTHPFPYVYFTFEHHVEQRLVDVSSCGAPDSWNRWVRMDNDCIAISDYTCCYGLRTSLSAVGDTYQYWCASGVRNVDFCH